MGHIKASLNLNKTPQLVESNSLVYAKNIKLLKDNTIGRDSGISAISAINTIISSGGYSIAGVIPYNTKFYVLLYRGDAAPYEDTKLVEYDENTNTTKTYLTDWVYRGGDIDGEVNVNLRSQTIITIAESFDTDNPDFLVPIKHLNLDYVDDKRLGDESLLTQTPKIPFGNLSVFDYNSNVIANGVYQFFIRYKIDEDFYTSWFPASKELFAATHSSMSTNQGGIKYVEDSKDSSYSFTFKVDFLFDDITSYYKKYQIGYILSHDNKTVGKKWREFDFSSTLVEFDMQEEFTIDIPVSELLTTPYNLYNIKNLTAFKNKLYVSNYIESDVNPTPPDESLGSVELHYKDLSLNAATLTHNNTVYLLSGSPIDYGGIYTIYPQIEYDDNTVAIHNLFDNFLISDVSVRDESYNNLITAITNGQDVPTSFPSTGRLYSLKSNDIIYPITSTVFAKKRSVDSYRGDSFPRTFNKFYIHTGYETTDNAKIFSSNDSVIEGIDGGEIGIKGAFKGIYGTNEASAYLNSDYRFQDRINNTAVEYKFATNAKLWKTSDDPAGSPSLTGPDALAYSGANILKVEADVTTYRITFVINVNGTLNPGYNDFKIISNITSLIPYQTYKFYIHYITANGEITNGYLLDEIQPVLSNNAQAGQPDDSNVIGWPGHSGDGKVGMIYPVFNNIKNINRDKYVAAFISIKHSANKVHWMLPIVNYEDDDAYTYYTSNYYPDSTVDSLANAWFSAELNTRLINLSDDIKIIASTNGPSDFKLAENVKGKYFNSSGMGDVRSIGSPGIVIAKSVSSNVYNGAIVQSYESNIKTDLVKCTPIFSLVEDDITITDIEDNMNLLGYICYVSPLLGLNVEYYVSGTDIYKKLWRSAGHASFEDITEDLFDYTSGISDLRNPRALSSASVMWSNYNLNYINKTVDYVPTSIYVTKQVEEKTESKRVPVTITNSLTISDIYELKSMYYDYIKPLFIEYDSIEAARVITRFNNTIRSSKLVGDENATNVFTFAPTDYYNVPTDKGIIVNLEAVGTNILVHTQDSLYRFLGYNSLTSSGGEDVQLQESNVFETGINELFGSKYGYAGLANKKDAIVTQNGYDFFDKDAKRIYHFDGQNDLKDISEPINKLFKDYDVNAVRFSNDYYNDRLFIQLIKNETHRALLSFNYRLNNFISLHDFDYNETFSTKVNCYFIKNNNIYKIDNNANTYGALTSSTLDNRYPCGISDGNQYAIVDIILNDNYENIKTLDSIRWICGEIKRLITYNQEDVKTATISYKGQAVAMNTNIPDLPDGDIDTLALLNSLMGEEAIDRGYCGDVLLLYTDSCASGNIALAPQNSTPLTYRSNLYSLFKLDAYNRTIPQNLAYEYPRYNLGYWSFNNFRNKISIKDVYNYLNTRANEDSRIKYMSDKRYESDNMSLIYGKYFVARFVFNSSRNFKLENVSFNITPTR